MALAIIMVQSHVYPNHMTDWLGLLPATGHMYCIEIPITPTVLRQLSLKVLHSQDVQTSSTSCTS